MLGIPTGPNGIILYVDTIEEFKMIFFFFKLVQIHNDSFHFGHMASTMAAF